MTGEGRMVWLRVIISISRLNTRPLCPQEWWARSGRERQKDKRTPNRPVVRVDTAYNPVLCHTPREMGPPIEPLFDALLMPWVFFVLGSIWGLVWWKSGAIKFLMRPRQKKMGEGGKDNCLMTRLIYLISVKRMHGSKSKSMPDKDVQHS